MNRKPRGIRFAWMACAALVLTACGDDEPTSAPSLDATIDADLAMVSADATIEDVHALRDARNGGSFMAERSGSRSVQFFDAMGTEQAEYDELTTESIYLTMEMDREIERDGWSASVSRTREMTVSGLEGVETTRIVNGTGSEEITRSRHSDDRGFRTREITGTRTIEDVVHPVPMDENSWPLSGTITRNMTVTVTTDQGTRTHSREVVIIFNGTQFPEMTVDGEPFEVDLGARDHERPFHEGRPHGEPGGHMGG
ncbi:MAG: hypothetical protein M8860_04845 [marine benthic group bacterium]|nr:hypothetical protein [Candidatus Carthagonibacter metallireducens]